MILKLQDYLSASNYFIDEAFILKIAMGLKDIHMKYLLCRFIHLQ